MLGVRGDAWEDLFETVCFTAGNDERYLRRESANRPTENFVFPTGRFVVVLIFFPDSVRTADKRTNVDERARHTTKKNEHRTATDRWPAVEGIHICIVRPTVSNIN